MLVLFFTVSANRDLRVAYGFARLPDYALVYERVPGTRCGDVGHHILPCHICGEIYKIREDYYKPLYSMICMQSGNSDYLDVRAFVMSAVDWFVLQLMYGNGTNQS